MNEAIHRLRLQDGLLTEMVLIYRRAVEGRQHTD